MANGFMGKFAHVDLTTGTIGIADIDFDYFKKFLGGKGVSTRLMWDHLKKLEAKGINIAELDALSPDNILIFSTGPGTGVPGFPSSGRHHVNTLKAPLTGSIGSANSGGNWGAYLKKAGYDGIIVEGKASSPKYLVVINGGLKLEDASELWGKNAFKTDEILQEKHKTDGVRLSVSCIAKAGENLLPTACIINDKYRAAGRTGVGAVMGSKNLKAIIVGGKNKVEIAKPEEFKEVSKRCYAALKENGVTGTGLPTYGTAVLVNIVNNIGALPFNNWQGAYNEKADMISGETLAKDYLIKNVPCWGCTISCGRAVSVKEGPYKLEYAEGPEYESIWAFGNSCGVMDYPAIIMANHLCNEYGLDTITIGSTIACAMELAEKGYIPAEDYAGLDLKFGSGAGLVESVKLIGQNTGFGKKLALGSLKLAEMYGHPELSMTMKGLEAPAYDPRAVKGIGLNYATSNRGGCHVTGYTIAPEVIGLPEQIDRLSYEGKATWVKIFQDFTCTVNSTVNCLFATFALGAADYGDLLTTTTGWDIKDSDVLLIGDRIYNLERLIMGKLGVKNQDTLPKRL
ncbi:MAG: aldehyde ferredoxin oxidoreductase family protein, partial [Promethearchaeota archaeon]